MDAEQYLLTYRHLVTKVELQRSKQERIRELCEHITKDMSEEKVQTSGAKDRLGSLVARLADLEAETMGYISEEIDALNEIEELITRLEDPLEASILQMVYIEGAHMPEVAVAIGKSESTVYRKKRSALKKIARMTGNDRAESGIMISAKE